MQIDFMAWYCFAIYGYLRISDYATVIYIPIIFDAQPIYSVQCLKHGVYISNGNFLFILKCKIPI